MVILIRRLLSPEIRFEQLSSSSSTRSSRSARGGVESRNERESVRLGILVQEWAERVNQARGRRVKPV